MRKREESLRSNLIWILVDEGEGRVVKESHLIWILPDEEDSSVVKESI